MIKTSLNLLTNSQVATLLCVRPNTLEIWRVQGRGPCFHKIGRIVRYVEADVLAWLEQQKRTNTTQHISPDIKS